MPDQVNTIERQKEESRTPYRALLRGLYDAVLLVNETGKIVDSNVRAEKFLQCNESELLHRTIMQIVSGFTIKMLETIRRDLNSGRFTVVHGYCLRVDGTSFPAEIAIGRVTTAERDALVFSIRNITIRKAMEEQLRTEHNALQNSTNSIAITNIDGAITHANPAFSRLSGVAESNMIGRHIRNFWQQSPETEQMFLAPRAGNNWTGELIGKLKKDSQPVRVHAMAAPNRNADGDQVGIVYSFVDISKLRQAEETLRAEAKAQIDSARVSDNFGGRLSLLSLTDVIQVIHTTEKSGMLTIVNEEGSTISNIGFASGAIIFASHLGNEGEDCVISAIKESGHSFKFDPDASPKRDETIAKATMTLLMEAAQEIDENR